MDLTPASTAAITAIAVIAAVEYQSFSYVNVCASRLEQYFCTIIISGEVGFGKPDPRIINRALPIMNCLPREVVMVGDNPSRDIAAAAYAGVKGILVKRGSHKEDNEKYQAFAEIETLSELPSLLASIT